MVQVFAKKLFSQIAKVKSNHHYKVMSFCLTLIFTVKKKLLLSKNAGTKSGGGISRQIKMLDKGPRVP